MPSKFDKNKYKTFSDTIRFKNEDSAIRSIELWKCIWPNCLCICLKNICPEKPIHVSKPLLEKNNTWSVKYTYLVPIQ